MSELAPGYYSCSPLTDLVAGDEIIAAILNNVVSGVSRVSVLYYDSIVSDGVRVSSNGNWVITKDSQSMQKVVSVGDVVGANEVSAVYSVAPDYFASLQDDINNIIIDQRIINNVYDETATPSGTGYSAAQMAEQARKLEEQDVGYFKRKRVERYG